MMANSDNWSPWTVEGDLIGVPCTTPAKPANDNVPYELRALGVAIGKVSTNDNLPDVVAFTGVAGSGKSTATRYLVEQLGYKLVKFAGPLKDMMRAIGFGEEEIEGSLKETSNIFLFGKTPRHAMQTLGTEWGRNCIHPEFWIGLWQHRVREVLADGGRVVTDDCRFPNEAAVVRKNGGDILKLVGRGGIAGNHESERGCGDEDLVILNDGAINELHGKIEEALRRYG
jgi:hypothetical protein